jgi:hypothetical protein
MRWPGSLGGRVAVALALAAAAIYGLQFVIERRDAKLRSARLAGSAVERPPAASPLQALGFVLRPTSAPVLVATRLQALAPDVAPVLQVLADGSVALRRPGRVAQTPLADGAGGSVGILVPVQDLAQLEPAARGTLVELLAALVVERPVPFDRVRLVDLQASGKGLGPVLAWVP